MELSEIIDKMKETMMNKHNEYKNSELIYENSIASFLSSEQSRESIRRSIEINFIPYLFLICQDPYERIGVEANDGFSFNFSYTILEKISKEYYEFAKSLLNNYVKIVEELRSDVDDDLHVAVEIFKDMKIKMIESDISPTDSFRYEYIYFESKYFKYIKDFLEKEYSENFEAIMLKDVAQKESSYIKTFINNISPGIINHLKDKYSHFYEPHYEYELYDDIMEHNEDLFEKDNLFLIKAVNKFLKGEAN